MKSPDHLGHIAFREADLHMIAVAAHEEPDDLSEAQWILSHAAGLFTAGLEFGLRFSRRHPELVDSALEWTNSIPSPGNEPLEMRERAMQQDIDKIVHGCGS